MATFEKRGRRWRAKVRLNGVTDSATFPTKAHAMQWALEREGEIKGGFKSGSGLHRMLKRYRDEVSPAKRGHEWEAKRIAAMLRQLPDKPLDRVTAEDVAAWRDARLKRVKGESFLRDLAVLSAAFEVARREWKWISHNPCRDIRRPARSRPRARIISDAERDAHVAALGFHGRVFLKKHEAAVAFLLALETGMRAGEIMGIRPEHIRGDHVHLPMTKNGRARDVPLSARARELLGLVPDGFSLDAARLDAIFRKHRPPEADYTFHDSRHTAVTRLARILPIMDLARMIGHTDTRMLLRYYNPSAGDIAKLLDASGRTPTPHP